ncbi:MAG: hypothetical protein ACP5UN_03750, partial [Candidatus Micrarchaeia archaeon]
MLMVETNLETLGTTQFIHSRMSEIGNMLSAPSSIAITPNGKYLYITNYGLNTFSLFSIGLSSSGSAANSNSLMPTASTSVPGSNASAFSSNTT